MPIPHRHRLAPAKAGADQSYKEFKIVSRQDLSAVDSSLVQQNGRTVNGDVEVLSGLSEGDRVALSPIDRLSDGARVEVRR